VSQKRPTFTTCYNFYIHSSIRQFLAQILPRKSAINMYFIFSPHLTTASALPGETGNLEVASFHLNVACFSPKNTKHSLKYHLVTAEPDRTQEGSIAS